jgi:hypothetical protein
MRTTTGKILYRRLIFNNTREGFQTLLWQVEAVRVQHGLKQVVFGMEPTANYHKPLGEFLINQEQQVVLVSPEAVKQNRPLLDGRWNKHDGKDCANIADLMCQGKCLFYEYPSSELRDLRNLLSLNRKLKQHRRRNPQFANLDTAFALILLCMLELEEVGAALNVIQIRMGERDDIEVIATGCRQIFFENRLKIDFRGAVVFGPFAVTEIEQHPASRR